MMAFPRVSIITSVFKCERFIQHFIEDVARQTIFFDCEILFLDADSPEEEAKHILAFQKCFPENVVYKRLERQFSLYETWNIGIDLARAPLLTNWNTDDRRVFNSLDVQFAEFAADPNLDVCYGPTLTTTNENESVEYCTSVGGFGCFEPSVESMLINNSPHCLPMWKKSLHDRFGKFDTQYFSAADYDFWLRCMIGGAKFKRIPFLVGSYYRNPYGISSDPARYSAALEEVAAVREKYAK